MKIAGKTILVTGAGRGIGLAIAKELLARGGKVDLGMRLPNNEVLNSLPNNEHARVVQLDMNSMESIDTFISLVNKEYDILINNAGQVTGGLLENQDISSIYQMYQVNLVGLTHLTQGLLKPMVKNGYGKIVNMSSVSGVLHFPAATTYAAAKTGVVAFTNCLSSELAGTGVSTLLLIPPGVQTKMFEEMDELYSKHVDTKRIKTISPKVYAERVVKAIERDKKILKPDGIERVLSFVAQHFPETFTRLSSTISGFKR